MGIVEGTQIRKVFYDCNGKTEAELQRAVARVLDDLGLLWCHCVNEGKRDFKTAAWLKAQGLKAGVPDVMIYTRTKQMHAANVAGVAIELKRNSNRPSVEQERWLSGLGNNNWVWAVCYDFKSVVDVLATCGFAVGHADIDHAKAVAIAPKNIKKHKKNIIRDSIMREE
jgi:hypothetical protein